MKVEIIRRNKLNLLGFHYGIRFSNGKIFENQKIEGLRNITSHQFSLGLNTVIEDRKFLSQQTINRLKNSLSSRESYNLFTNNCEHFARDVMYGDKSSKQVNLLVLIFLGLVTYKIFQE